jgi:hypothetical protein
LLPLVLILGSIVVVAELVAIAHGKRPECKVTTGQAVLVEHIPARLTSLNFAVYSQGSVTPRTETTLVAEVAAKSSDS